MGGERKEREKPLPWGECQGGKQILRRALSKVCHSTNGNSLEHSKCIEENGEIRRANLNMPEEDKDIRKTTFEVVQNRRKLVKIPLSAQLVYQERAEKRKLLVGRIKRHTRN